MTGSRKQIPGEGNTEVVVALDDDRIDLGVRVSGVGMAARLDATTVLQVCHELYTQVWRMGIITEHTRPHAVNAILAWINGMTADTVEPLPPTGGEPAAVIAGQILAFTGAAAVFEAVATWRGGFPTDPQPTETPDRDLALITAWDAYVTAMQAKAFREEH